MLRQYDRGTELTVYPRKHCQKIGRSDGVKLPRGLIKDEHRRLHRHDRGQIQHLLLPARQLRNVFIKPAFYAEKARHFSRSAADGLTVIAEAFHAESELMPDLVRNYLIIGALEHKAYLLRLLAPVGFLKGLAPENDLAAAHSVRGKLCLELPQER